MVSLHLRWPWPRAQAAHAAAIEEALAELDGPAVVGGDFNMLPWGHSVQRLADAVGGAPVRPAPGTRTLAGVLPLAIDHVIATGRRPGVSQRRPPIGSDHHGVPGAGVAVRGRLTRRRARATERGASRTRSPRREGLALTPGELEGAVTEP